MVIKQCKDIISRSGADLEYCVIVNEFTLEKEEYIDKNSILAVAAKIDKSIRLIDNSKLYPSAE
jgi:pantothenate synthetase